jgi:hypothetical protein
MELAGLFVGMGLFGLGFWALLVGLVLLAFVLSPAVFLLLWILSKIPGVMPKAADPTMPKEGEANTETVKNNNSATEDDLFS